jgi:hypothetical protein
MEGSINKHRTVEERKSLDRRSASHRHQSKHKGRLQYSSWWWKAENKGQWRPNPGGNQGGTQQAMRRPSKKAGKERTEVWAAADSGFLRCCQCCFGTAGRPLV